VQPILRGGGDPRLRGAVERDDLVVAGRRRGVVAERVARSAGGDGDSAGAQRGEQLAARQRQRVSP